MQQVAADLFECGGKDYLCLVDRYSGYLWVNLLRRTSTDDGCEAPAENFPLFWLPSAVYVLMVGRSFAQNLMSGAKCTASVMKRALRTIRRGMGSLKQV